MMEVKIACAQSGIKAWCYKPINTCGNFWHDRLAHGLYSALINVMDEAGKSLVDESGEKAIVGP